MAATITLQPIAPSSKKDVLVSAAQTLHGAPVPPIKRLKLFSANDWEEFVNDWAHYAQKERGVYIDVVRFSGAGDRGIDVAGFTDVKGLKGVWDAFQCKHYKDPLTPSVAKPEIAKLLWFTFVGEFVVPRAYYFMAPHGIGTKLNTMLKNHEALRQDIIATWDKDCRTEVKSTKEIPLDGQFLAYVRTFDFSIFQAKQPSVLIDDHRQFCPTHLSIFGGGLPAMPVPSPPPPTIQADESHYVEELLKAYAEHKKTSVSSHDDLKKWPTLNSHFTRQREAFYQAESLRVFVRDKVEPGTFERLQEEIFVGVVDTRDMPHADGYVRVCAVTKAAQDMQLNANPVASIAQTKDRHGICHQLANEDRLKWTD